MSISLLDYCDYTSLKDGQSDDLGAINEILSQAGKLPVGFCTWQQHVPVLAGLSAVNAVKIKSIVANFPHGTGDLGSFEADLKAANLDPAIQEIDFVFDWQAWAAGDKEAAVAKTAAARALVPNKRFKVIVESGQAQSPEAVCEIAEALLRNVQIDFLKTSTGKTAVGATTEAVAAFLKAMEKTGVTCGVKVSGGVRTEEAAMGYYNQVASFLGKEVLTAMDFRIGTSTLFNGQAAADY